MNFSARVAGVTALLLLATAHASRAQQPDSVATRGPLPGRGAIGGQIGSSWIYSEEDYSSGSQPRLSFVGHFRYVINRSWGWQVSPYFTWNGYVSHVDAPFVDPNFPSDGQSKEEYLTQVLGADTQLQWFFKRSARERWHLGVGPALYRVVVENQRKVVKDPVTLERHSTTHLGVNGELAMERFLRRLPNASIELSAAWHMAFARDDVKWVSGWNGAPQLVEFRVGAHYYYDFRKSKPKSTKPGLAH